MRQRHLNQLFTVALAMLAYLIIFPNEKSTTQTEPINYELYKYKFEEINSRIEKLDAQDVVQDTVLKSIKFKLVTDEKTLRSSSYSDIDSIFNAMVARQYKSRVQ